MGVLLELAAQTGEVVDRQALLSKVWGSEMATDDVLSRAISELRRALGDDPRQPRFVETVRGSGYRLLVPHDGGAPATTAAVASTTPADVERAAGVIERQDRATRIAATDDRAGRPTPGARRRAVFAVASVAVVVAVATGVLRAWPRPAATSRLLQVAPLTTRPGEESAPRLSPDGTRIAYSWLDEQQRVQHNYVRLVADGSEIELTTGVGQHHLSAWSPDGAQLAVTKMERGQWSLSIVPALGGPERIITHVSGAYVLGLDWSPNGQDLVYAAQDSAPAPFGIRIRNLQSRRERRLTDGAATAFGDVYSTFSPDGRFVAFVRFFTEVASDVYVVPVEGGAVRRLTTDERAIGAIAFSADGRAVLYTVNRDGRSAVWRVELPGSPDAAPTKIYESSAGIQGLTTFRGGPGFVVAEGERDLNLWRVGVNGAAAPERLIASTRVDALPRHSPDGARIAFVSNRSGDSELWVAQRDGGNAVRLTTTGRARGGPAWSPNGAAIAYEHQSGARSAVAIVDVATRTARPAAASVTDAVAPSWSRDGRWLYLSSRRDGRWEVFRVPTSGGVPEQVTTSGGLGARETVDGTAILFAKPYMRGLWRLDLNTRQETLLVPDLAAGDCTNWDVAAGGVYFVRRGDDGRQELVFRAFDASAARTIVRGVRVPVGSGGISLSPDGGHIVYAQIDRRDGDLSLVQP